MLATPGERVQAFVPSKMKDCAVHSLDQQTDHAAAADFRRPGKGEGPPNKEVHSCGLSESVHMNLL